MFRHSQKPIVAFVVLTLIVGLMSGVLVPMNGGYSRSASYIVQAQSSAEARQLVEAQGGVVTSDLPVIHGVGALLTEQAVRALSAHSGVSIHSNTRVGASSLMSKNPNLPDTDYPEVVGADYLWQQGITGEGVSVAIIDTGIAREHPGLWKDINGNNGHIIAWVDFVQGKKNPRDPNGHGSHIAGIIANTEIGEDGGWNGVAPGVDLVGIRVLDETGYGSYETVIQGIQWAIEHKEDYNIRVINLSLVGIPEAPYWADPLNQAVMRAWQSGMVVVVAAGNDGPDPMTIGVPGNNPYVITVGAFTDNYTPLDWNDDYITPFSAAGPTLDGFVKPDLVAPGAHMVSSMMGSSYLWRTRQANRVGPRYFSMAGTSHATAVVSAVAALMISHNPELTPDQVKYRLQATSLVWIDPETTDAAYSMFQQGAGRINAPDAVLFEGPDGVANIGMDIQADLDGTVHYEGYGYYDEEAGVFKLRDTAYGTWAGAYGTWAGAYGTWAGAYGTWAGAYGTWAGTYGTWAGAYGTWAGAYGTWAGTYGTWAGAYGTWAGTYGTWAGGYGTWAGGYGTWAGGYGTWAGAYGDAAFAANFVNWTPNENQGSTWNGSFNFIGCMEQDY